MDPDGSVRIRYIWKQPVMAVLPAMEWVGPGSFWEMSAEIRIPQADLDRYADFEWSSFDVDSLERAEGRGGFAGHRAAANVLKRDDDRDCRFTGSFSLACRFHHTAGGQPDYL